MRAVGRIKTHHALALFGQALEESRRLRLQGLTSHAAGKALGLGEVGRSSDAVEFISPVNGAYLPNTFTVRFGLTKMGVSPAGIDKPNTGHHHLLVDAPLPPLDKPIPNDENHLHFGAGQTETVLTLPTGRHTLQLLLGDTAHLPHQPPVYSDPVIVNVGIAPPPPPRPVRRHRHAPYYLHRA